MIQSLPLELFNLVILLLDIKSICCLKRICRDTNKNSCLNKRLNFLQKKQVGSFHERKAEEEMSISVHITVIIDRAYLTVIAIEDYTHKVNEIFGSIKFGRSYICGSGSRSNSTVISYKEAFNMYVKFLPENGFKETKLNGE